MNKKMRYYCNFVYFFWEAIKLNDYTEICRILKPQGLDGEIKAKILSDNDDQLKDIIYLYLGNNHEKLDVEYINSRQGFSIIKFKKFNKIEDVEHLRNQYLFIDKTQIRKLSENEWFINDIIGCNLINEKDEIIGEILDIEDYSVVKNVVAKKLDCEFSFPFLDSVILKVDIKNKAVFINSDRLDEVIVVED